MKVVYTHDYGQETYGEVREPEDGLFECYFNPLFGGEFYYDSVFINLELAIQYLKSIT